MNQRIRDVITPSCDLLGFGEPVHQEPAFGWIRNELFAQLVSPEQTSDRAFRSIVLETDRVAALRVNEYVQGSDDDLDTVMSNGFSHGFGELDTNRQLIAWMREFNENRPAEERLTFHGFDAPTENTTAPSPHSYLEYARDHLGLDLDLAVVAGDDERWSRQEAILDPTMSPGATPEAEQLRHVGGELLDALRRCEPDTAAAAHHEWQRAATYLGAGLGLLRYHRQAAERLEPENRISRLLATRDALMARNLLDIRRIEERRGPTLVFAHNLHLQRNSSGMPMSGMDLGWFGAGALVAPMLGDEYTFVAGSLGSSDILGLSAPDPDTFEGILQKHCATWGLNPVEAVASGRLRTDTRREQGYFPLTRETLDAADAVLHISGGGTIRQSAATGD